GRNCSAYRDAPNFQPSIGHLLDAAESYFLPFLIFLIDALSLASNEIVIVRSHSLVLSGSSSWLHASRARRTKVVAFDHRLGPRLASNCFPTFVFPQSGKSGSATWSNPASPFRR